MRMQRFLASAAMLAVLSVPAVASPNLVHNADFHIPRPGLVPPGHPPSELPMTDFTSTRRDALGGLAAADEWLTWTGVPGGRVWTRLEPSELFVGARMLHVRGYEVDQVFAPVHTGSRHGYFCALVKVVAGRVGAGAGDQGNSGPGMTVGPADGWVRIAGSEQSFPVNQVAIFGNDTNAEFYIQHVELSPEPIPCDPHVDMSKLVLPERYVQPDPYPWTMHPEQAGVVQPAAAGNPAFGNQASPNGHYENMTPGTKGGGGKPADQTPENQQPPTKK